MNLEEKTKMAHEYAIEMAKQGISLRLCKELGWKYADAMEAEYNKREKEQKDKIYDPMRSVRNAKEFQVDWSVAPKGTLTWAIDSQGEATWANYDKDGNYLETLIAPSFGYQGDWKDSLRKRPK